MTDLPLTADDRAWLHETRARHETTLSGPDREDQDVLLSHRYARAQITRIDRMLRSGHWTY